MLEIKPRVPTTKINFGFVIVGGSSSLCRASIKMVKHNAIKKTALIRAPKISARNQPYVYSASAERFLATFTAHNATTKEMISFNIWKESAIRANELTI